MLNEKRKAEEDKEYYTNAKTEENYTRAINYLRRSKEAKEHKIEELLSTFGEEIT